MVNQDSIQPDKIKFNGNHEDQWDFPIFHKYPKIHTGRSKKIETCFEDGVPMGI